MDIKIEKVTKETLSFVKNALKKGFEIHPQYISRLPVDETYIVRDGDILMGVTVHPEVEKGKPVSTGWTSVHPDYRQQGIYTALMDFKIAVLKSSGASEIITKVPYSHIMNHLIEKYGFVVIGVCELSPKWGSNLKETNILKLTL